MRYDLLVLMRGCFVRLLPGLAFYRFGLIVGYIHSSSGILIYCERVGGGGPWGGFAVFLCWF